MKYIVMIVALILSLLACSSHSGQLADPLIETRYTDVVKRNASGDIIRRADVLKAFQKIHPCPSTGLPTGKCPGWQMNHVIPLACGGVDAVSNLMWVHVSIKTGSAATCPYCIDRVERKISASIPPVPDTANCVNSVIP
jgi:hypothetical protein